MVGQRRSSSPKHGRLDEMGITKDIKYIELDVLDQTNVRRAIEKTQPDEAYNLVAQSFVAELNKGLEKGNVWWRSDLDV